MWETTQLMNLDCIELANDAVSLLITKNVGPRILKLSVPGGENLLAELPLATLDCPGKGVFNLWGGHRLWHAPEKASRTYLPDNRPLTITETTGGVRVVQPVEPETGLQKMLTISLPDNSATVVVEHTLTNRGVWGVECAPWAITQMRKGGTAVLPLNTQPLDDDGLLPNRPIAFWPYTDINSPHLKLTNAHIFIDATMTAGAMKIGFPNPHGWMAYWLEGMLFVKTAVFQPNATYYDFGSSSECYCNDKFLELETLGPRTIIQPGDSVTHRELWYLFTDVPMTSPEALAAHIPHLMGDRS